MASKSIFYRHPWLYKLSLQLVHNKHYQKRYNYMKSFVKKNETVLEPGCGPATLASYLPAGVTYSGFDMNDSFIADAKTKGYDVKIGNVLEAKNYKAVDWVIGVDIFHHLTPETRKKFIENCFKSATKGFILCEPTYNKGEENSIFFPLKKFMVEWFEQDGTNHVSINHGFEREEYLGDIKKGFGVIPTKTTREVEIMGADVIVVFLKK